MTRKASSKTTRRSRSRDHSGEFERIQWMLDQLSASARHPHTTIGPGDDAAAWRVPKGKVAVTSVDTQVEGVHFRRSWLSPQEIGQRAIAAAASDLAAMAARPSVALFAFTLPTNFSDREFRELFRGCVGEAKSYGLDVLGGNLSGGPLSVTTTVIGYGDPRKLVRRCGARPGDALFVTGAPGRSRLGRALLESGASAKTKAARACLTAFRHPQARIAAATALARRVRIHALIDISDGVAPDLEHLLEASSGQRRAESLGAALDMDAITGLLDVEFKVQQLCEELGCDPVKAVLEGGEDFELLFAVAPSEESRVNSCARQLQLPMTRIGTVESPCQGVVLVSGAQRRRRWRTRGYDHFRRRK